MFAISLILIGISMFLNGFLPIIDENDNNEVVVMNVISGVITLIFSIFGIINAQDTLTLIEYGTILLFSITNLYIAGVNIWYLSESSLGWFSMVCFVISVAIGIFYLLNANTMFAILYFVWALVWLSYFVSRALNVLQKTSSYVIMLGGAIALISVGLLLISGILVF